MPNQIDCPPTPPNTPTSATTNADYACPVRIQTCFDVDPFQGLDIACVDQGPILAPSLTQEQKDTYMQDMVDLLA